MLHFSTAGLPGEHVCHTQLPTPPDVFSHLEYLIVDAQPLVSFPDFIVYPELHFVQSTAAFQPPAGL